MAINSAEIVRLPEFKDFLIESKRHGYGTPHANVAVGKGGEKIITWKAGSFYYQDSFVGGNPYCGYEFVSVDDGNGYKPVWSMSYYEPFLQAITGKQLGSVLSKVLPQPDPELPVRGPKDWEEDGFVYALRPEGEVGSLARFSVVETLTTSDGRRLYAARFMGGLIDSHA